MSVEVEQGDKDDSSNQILSMKKMKKRLWWIERHPQSLQVYSLPIYTSYMEKKQKS